MPARLLLAAVLLLLPAAAAPQVPSTPSDGWLRQLRFSPDGQQVLAQDDSEITVMTVRPFEILFRLPAENATFAQFTPDSKEVVFVSSITRVNDQQVVLSSRPAHVERWSVAGSTRTSFTDVPLHACDTVALSPDGRTVVCVDFEGMLQIMDVSSGTNLFERQKFARREFLGSLERPCFEMRGPHGKPVARLGDDWTDSCYEGDAGAARVAFSPDSRFVIIEPEFEGAAIEWDLSQRSPIPPAGNLKRLLKPWPVWSALPFAFVAPNLVLLNPKRKPSKSDQKDDLGPFELVSFPSGTLVSILKLPRSPDLFPATDSNFVLMRRYGRRIIDGGNLRYTPSTWRAALEFRSGHELITSDQTALDVSGQYYVAQPNPSEVNLYERGKGIRDCVVLRKK